MGTFIHKGCSIFLRFLYNFFVRHPPIIYLSTSFMDVPYTLYFLENLKPSDTNATHC